MDTFSNEDLRLLLTDRPGPCVSLYVPIHPDAAKQGSIVWRDLLAGAAKRLTTMGLRPSDAANLLTPAVRLASAPSSWAGGAKGVACFLAPGFARSYRLGLNWPARVVAGDRFFVKPVLPWLAGGRFYVLVTGEHDVRLLRGTPHGAERVELPDGSLNPAPALAAHGADEPLILHKAVGRGPERWEAVPHSRGADIEDIRGDLRSYFRAVDRALHALLQDERAPVVYAGDPSTWSTFRDACNYPLLLDDRVPGDPERLCDADLVDLARPLVEPLFERRRRKAMSAYRRLIGTGRTSREVAEVVPAACRGRVEMVFVTTQDVWGRYDPIAGRVEVHGDEQPGDEELTNLAAVGALHRGRAVHVVAAEEMPDGAALAAISPLPLPKHGGKRP